jgi:hypothetical protein
MAEFDEKDSLGCITIHKMTNGKYFLVEGGLTTEEQYYAIMAAYYYERQRMIDALVPPEPAKARTVDPPAEGQ